MINRLTQKEDVNKFGWLVGKPCDMFASKRLRRVFCFYLMPIRTNRESKILETSSERLNT